MIVRFVVDFLGFALWIVLSSAFMLLLLWAWNVIVLRQPRRDCRRIAYERYEAERFIRETRRHAISELLEADRDARRDVIEGTAVEVRR